MRALSYFLLRYVLRRKTILAEAPEFGIRVRFRTEDSIGRHIYKRGGHELGLSRLLRRHLAVAPGEVVLDVGANLGWYSLLFERIAPDGAVIVAFEPAPENHALLVENLRLNAATKVRALQKAVSDEAATATLHLYSSKNLGRHSLLPLHEGPTVTVDTIPLDAALEAEGLSARPVAIAKVDVEGLEDRVFRGARRTLDRTRIVLSEHVPKYVAEGGAKARESLDLLAGAGFTSYEIDGERLRPIAIDEIARADRRVNLLWSKGALDGTWRRSLS